MLDIKNQIPTHWQLLKFAEIIEFLTDFQANGSFAGLKENVRYYSEPNYAVLVRLKDLRNDLKDEHSFVYTDEKGYNFLRKSRVVEGDILVANVGAGVGTTLKMSKFNGLGTLGPNMFRVDLKKIILAKFFLEFSNSINYWQQLQLVSAGSGQPKINKSQYKSIEIPIPPLTEQLAIVSKIEELLSDLENGTQQLLLAQQQLKVYRQSLLKWAFEGKLTNENLKNNLPTDWKKIELKAVCEIKRGKSKHRPRNEPSLYGGRYPFVQTGDIRNANGGYINTFNQTYNEIGLQQSKLWPKGTLCITIAANIGETAILGLDACFPDSIVGLVCDEKFILNKFTNYFFISYKTKLEELAPATAQKNINVDILEKVKIPLPPLREQQLIINELESKLTVCDKIEETINQSLDQAEMLRQSILKRAFEGKLI